MPPRKHHVFLSRHCVRSTQASISFFSESSDKTYHASNFTASPLPNWNVPTKWCTELGMDIMKKAGFSIFEEQLSLEENQRILKVQVITDTVQRDVDSSFSLFQGISNAVTASGKAKKMPLGLSDLNYDQSLFSPIDGPTPFCKQKYTAERLSIDIANRLKLVPPPDPNLKSTLLSLERIGGIGSFGSLISIQPNSSFVLNPRKMKLEGAINLVKLFAQMMFYSRAGGIDPPFLPNATSYDVYRFVEWIHWSRSVLSVDNVKSATEGVVIANAILESLENGNYNIKGSDARIVQNQNYDSSFIFIVGHDSDLDNVATALGLRWKVEAPYRSGKDEVGEYVPTPPGATMHFQYDEATGIIEMSYLYPVYPIDETDTSGNTDVVLKRTPLVFSPPLSNIGVTVATSQEGLSTLISPTNNSIKDASLKALRQRLISTLDKYPEASECYYKSANYTNSHLMEKETGFWSTLGNSYIEIWLTATLLLTLSYVSRLFMKGKTKVT